MPQAGFLVNSNSNYNTQKWKAGLSVIGERIRQARESAGHTQTSLAELLNIQPKQLWRWETGRYTPEADTLINLSKALNVSADYLLGLTDDPIRATRLSELTDTEQEVIMALRRDDVRGVMRAVLASEAARGRP